MKTDKELLILAANAAGFNSFDGHALQMIDSGWNPLTDDGDALRLVVDLDITLAQLQYSTECVYYIDGDEFDPIHERHSNDKHAATRRAIVRAAAAIGEGM